MAADNYSDNPVYRLAAFDQDFVLGDSMRGARFMMEYAKAEEYLRYERVRSTIVAFGSARIREDGGEWQSRIYNAARTFGRIASERGGALCDGRQWRDNVIATGGGPGVMEAANRGARDAGAVTIGFNIQLPHEQFPNPYITPDLNFQFHYFAMRKMHLAMRARALMIFPGGFGTMDELFEFLTLSQTGKGHHMPVVLYDRNFWTRIINFEAFAEAGMISPDDLNLFEFADDPEEAWESLLRRGLEVPEI
ncbi:MAG: 3-isopropylmalate dehydrogenase [Hyphomonas sp.]|uniref:LOG family protein n=1 Tax=Hyphomonas sp. TaxID=87 RepID=UPI001DF7356E|nr:LOG family protein [Hyphomonas sp.]MBA4228197.1 3-isopropylmalate dehydrogenase [Hyphomonas sp.]